MTHVLNFLFLPALALTSLAAVATDLSLDDYLSQVETGSPSVAAARLHADGGYQRAGGASVLTFPYAFGNFNPRKAKSKTAPPPKQASGPPPPFYPLGMGKNSPSGLKGKSS